MDPAASPLPPATRRPKGRAGRALAAAATGALLLLARAVTAVRADLRHPLPEDRPFVVVANHRSHADSVLVWAALPRRLRRRTRPVAAAEYWLASPLRRLVGQGVFDALLIDRDPARRRQDPVAQMAEALDAGASLILFPEGTRNTTDARLLPLRSGLFHLAAARPGVDLVPAWIANLDRVMPKGGFVPVPLACTVTFGAPLRLASGEAKADFLDRAAAALLALAPPGRPPAEPEAKGEGRPA